MPFLTIRVPVIREIARRAAPIHRHPANQGRFPGEVDPTRLHLHGIRQGLGKIVTQIHEGAQHPGEQAQAEPDEKDVAFFRGMDQVGRGVTAATEIRFVLAEDAPAPAQKGAHEQDTDADQRPGPGVRRDFVPDPHERHSGTDGDGQTLDDRRGQSHAEQVERKRIREGAHAPAETKEKDKGAGTPPGMSQRQGPAGQEDVHRDERDDDGGKEKRDQSRIIHRVTAENRVHWKPEGATAGRRP